MRMEQLVKSNWQPRLTGSNHSNQKCTPVGRARCIKNNQQSTMFFTKTAANNVFFTKRFVEQPCAQITSKSKSLPFRLGLLLCLLRHFCLFLILLLQFCGDQEVYNIPNQLKPSWSPPLVRLLFRFQARLDHAQVFEHCFAIRIGFGREMVPQPMKTQQAAINIQYFTMHAVAL